MVAAAGRWRPWRSWCRCDDEEGRRLRPYLLGTLALVEAFMALLLIFQSNPFTVLPMAQADGMGLNPLLENVGMIFHPPTLFIGYALYTIPFAFVVAGLLSGQSSDTWMARTRRWSLMAWLFLSVGIILGAWWAYVELGWGGYWGWDPVENSSLIPWLVGTAALHSAAMQFRRGIFRIWTATLNLLTFGLCIFATFVTRSGVIQSVHAFGRSPIGAYFAIFLALVMAGGFGLLIARRRTLADKYQMDSYLSREAGFLLANLLLVGSAAVVFLGTDLPGHHGIDSGAAGGSGRSRSTIEPSRLWAWPSSCSLASAQFWAGVRRRWLAFGKRLLLPGGLAVLGVVLLLVLPATTSRWPWWDSARSSLSPATFCPSSYVAWLPEVRTAGEKPSFGDDSAHIERPPALWRHDRAPEYFADHPRHRRLRGLQDGAAGGAGAWRADQHGPVHYRVRQLLQ